MVCLCFIGGGGYRGLFIKLISSVYILVLVGVIKDISIMDMVFKGNIIV